MSNYIKRFNRLFRLHSNLIIFKALHQAVAAVAMVMVMAVLAVDLEVTEALVAAADLVVIVMDLAAEEKQNGQQQFMQKM